MPQNSGFYGKIPSHGDFIDRNLGLDFINSWDSWLHQCLSNSRERLGEDWLELYLTSPIWRFMLSPGALDHQAWAGILSPSVDSVGRFFPLTIAMPLLADTGLSLFCQQNETWFKTLEACTLAALHEGLTAEQLSQQLEDGPAPQLNTQLVQSEQEHRGQHLAVSAPSLAEAMACQLDGQIVEHYASHSLWFSIYTRNPAQNLLLAHGLPNSDQYTAMLDGQWQLWGWQTSDQ